MKINFKVLLIAMFLAISYGSFAENIIVSGAGSSEVDGYYVEDGERNSRPIYKYNDGTTDWAIAWTGSIWALGTDDGSMIVETYYENVNDLPTCPNSDWQQMMGMEPIPTFSNETENAISPTYTVSGGAFFDGKIFSIEGIQNDRPAYLIHETYYDYRLFWSDSKWMIVSHASNVMGGEPINYYFFNTSDEDTPPLTGWEKDEDAPTYGSVPTLEGEATPPPSPNTPQYEVIDGGEYSVNGIYTEAEIINGKPSYISSSNYKIYWTGSLWEISDEYDTKYYWNYSEEDTPPSSGWEYDFETVWHSPAPTVQLYTAPAVPEIDIRCETIPIRNGGSVYFDNQQPNTTTEITLTLENSGSASAYIYSFSTYGSESGEFSNTLGYIVGSLESSETIVFNVQFIPNSFGSKVGVIEFSTSDADEKPYTIYLRGYSKQPEDPEIDVKQGSTLIADETGTYDFGSQGVYLDTDADFTIQNIGLLPSTLGSYTISGTNADQFSFQGTNPESVSASGTANFTIRFTPTSIGSKTAIVSFANQDPDENPYNFTITGTGLTPTFSLGAGTSGDPFKIETLNDLKILSEYPEYWVADLYFIQTADIDASETSTWNAGAGFIPIGNISTNFQGNYDGGSFTIDGLFINTSGDDFVGLFGYTASGSGISNLNITNVDITGSLNVGGLCGINYATISNVSSTGSVEGFSSVGGLCGSNYDAINNSYSAGSVLGSSEVGGFCGYNDNTTISNSYSTSSVNGDNGIGGFCGYNDNGIISNSYATGSVTGNAGSDYVGGFCGENAGTITNSYATGLVTGETNTGGFCGSNSATINTSFWDTQTSTQATSDGGTGKLTTDMKTESTFTSVTWDFIGETANGTDDYWGMKATINDGYPVFYWQIPVVPMELVFTTTDASQSIELPLYGTVTCTVDWGDGSDTEDFDTEGNYPHTFATAGTYTVTISGSLEIFGYPGSDWTGVEYLTHVNSFGNLGLSSIAYAFRNADNLISVPTELPASITNISAAFSAIDQVDITNLSSWDVSNVTNMGQLFWEASNFNGSGITEWNTSNVEYMYYMFNGANAFNQDISGWDVENVTNMSRMFYHATAFDQDINGWTVDNVTQMDFMFAECYAFNQDLNDWNVGNVTNMRLMFTYATSFDGNISDWNTENVEEMDYMFRTASSFSQDISGWDVSKVTNMSGMFKSASAFNQDISNWERTGSTLAYVTDMSYMFDNASIFNQNLGNWDVGLVTNMTNMFLNITLSTTNYDAILLGWSAQTVQSNVEFDGGNSQYSAGAAATARASLIADDSWIITDGGQAPQPMELVFTTNDVNQSIELPLYGIVSYTVDWGDGSGDVDEIHTFASAGTYTVTISGEFAQFGYYDGWIGVEYLTEVVSFGDVGLTSLHAAFYDADNLISVPATLPSTVLLLENTFRGIDQVSITNLDLWDVSNVESMSGTFFNAVNFNQDISSWDVSNVHSMSSLFYGASIFNQDISNWNVSNVTAMQGMFYGASAFNQDISTKIVNAGQPDEYTAWNVSSVTNMQMMFAGASEFNQNIGNWDVSNVTTMYGMFENATVFNQDISTWNVSNVTNIAYMFHIASAFNQDISTKIINAGQSDEYTAWDVSNVENMKVMLAEATSFNQNIGNWNVSNVINMEAMFASASIFNQDISNWVVSNVINMGSMFSQASIFNQDISNWNVSSLTTMGGMFAYANSFNQDISSWNVSNVTYMGYIFYDASAFDQDLSSWQIGAVTDMTEFFTGATISTANYDAILIGWAAQSVQADVIFGGGNSMYSCGAAADARQSLIDNHNWAITDGGYTDETAPEEPTLETLTGECSVTAVAPTTNDACAGTIEGTTSDPLFYNVQGTYTITWNFDDRSGNSIDVEQYVVVEDITDPTITCIEDMEVTADENLTYTVIDTEFDPTATDDNCEVISVTNDINGTETLAGETLAQGETHIITWTVTDIAGNETSCEFDVLVNNFVGIADLSEIGISIYPNPSTGIFTIETEGNYEVTITDISGKNVTCNVSTSQIDLSNHANGIYFIKFQNSETVKTIKIIKQ